MADFPKRVWFYVASVVIVGISLAIWQLWEIELSLSFILSWLILAILDLFCELYEVQLMARHMTSAAIAVGMSAVFIGGPKLGLLVVLTGSTFAEVLLRRRFLKISPAIYVAVVLFNVTQLATAVILAGLLFQVLGGESTLRTALDFVRAAGVFFVFLTINHAIVAGAVHFSRGVSYWRHLRTILRVQYVQLISLGILAILIAIVYSISPWYSFLVLVPLFVVQISLREHLKLREQAKAAFEKIAAIIHARDSYTGQHSEEVADL
ncbi:MAG: hypothetical protein H5T41_11245, partial [Methanomassiliicoccales archaeon]|nr:hypothetical protein [Methanomassiliicoccales archaeon]